MTSTPEHMGEAEAEGVEEEGMEMELGRSAIAEPYVVAWPGIPLSLQAGSPPPASAWPASERVLDEEDFEDLTQSSLITPTSSLLAAAMQHEATHDSLLDALARLQEERARNERLARQVEVARALAALPNSGEPARAATVVASACRRSAARAAATALRRAAESRAACMIQARARLLSARRARLARAAALLQASLGAYVRSATRKSALRRALLRERAAHAATRAAHAAAIAKSERQMDAAIERQLDVLASHKAAGEEGHRREGTLAAALAAAEHQIGELRAALANTRAAREDRQPCDTSPAASLVAPAPARMVSVPPGAETRATDDRVAELEALATRLAVEKADLASELQEVKDNERALEVKGRGSA